MIQRKARQKHSVEETRIEVQVPKWQKPELEIYPVTESNESNHTKQAYKNSFNRFLKHIKIFDLQVLLNQGPDVLKQMIIKYVIFRRDERKLSKATIEAECAAISHFFDMNDMDLNKKRIKRFLPPDESTHDDRLYTQEEEQRILAECDKRQQVIVLLMNSAGLRIGAIHVLKISDLEFIRKYNIYKITVYGRSKPTRHWTLYNPECYNAIQDYLQQREKQGEGTIKGTSPLVREQCDPEDYIRTQSPSAGNSTITSTSPVFVFTFEYPSNWTTQESITLMSPRSSDFDMTPEVISIQTERLPPGITLAEYTESGINQLTSLPRQNFSIIDSSPTTLAGLPAHYNSYLYRRRNKQ
jgi:integrase